MIIGLVGFKSSGKDTAANILVEQHGFQSIAFADSIKDCLSSIFCWDREMMQGHTPESREWREQVDPWWVNKLGIPKFSPRWAMTHFGTNLMRDKFDQKIWIHNVERRLEQSKTRNLVLSDCRFPNEIEVIRNQSGKIWRINRGVDPIWMNVAKTAAKPLRTHDVTWNQSVGSARAMLAQMEIHESEWAWVNEPLDFNAMNDSTFENLENVLNDGLEVCFA